MIVVTSPRENHLFSFVDAVLIRWVALIARSWSSKELIINWRSTTTKRSLTSASELVLPIHCGSSTVSQSSSNYVMIGSALNISYFGIKQGEYHLRWTNVITNFLFYNLLTSIIIVHVKLWSIWLLATKLSKIISSKWIYKATGSKQQCMFKPASNFRYKRTLDLF